MKTFYLIRHAKSEHGPQFATDFERTLNDRGRKDAKLVSSFLKKSDFMCQVFISSPAKRAGETEDIFYKTLGKKSIERVKSSDLYLPPGSKIWEVINMQSDDYSRIALFSHNPGVEEFILMLNGDAAVPTCFFGHFESDCNHWNEAGVHNTKLINSITPKMLK